MTYSLRTDDLSFLLITVIFSFKTISLNAQNKSTESCRIEIDIIIIIIIIIYSSSSHARVRQLQWWYGSGGGGDKGGGGGGGVAGGLHSDIGRTDPGWFNMIITAQASKCRTRIPRDRVAPGTLSEALAYPSLQSTGNYGLNAIYS